MSQVAFGGLSVFPKRTSGFIRLTNSPPYWEWAEPRPKEWDDEENYFPTGLIGPVEEEVPPYPYGYGYS